MKERSYSPQNHEVISVGDKIQLFAPQATIVHPDDSVDLQKLKNCWISCGQKKYERNLQLSIPGFPQLPVTFTMYHQLCDVLDFALFSPEQGYQVTSEDLEHRSRMRKVNDMLESGCSYLYEGEIGLEFRAQIHFTDTPAEDPDLRKLYKGLRFYLYSPQFPGPLIAENFQGGPTGEKKILVFNKFFPSDTGPLPPWTKHTRTKGIWDGHYATTQADIQQVEQLYGKFVYIDPLTDNESNQ